MTDKPASRPDFNGFWWETSKIARQAQIEYGRWIVNTLWLMHSGAIAGLLFRWDGKDPVPHRLAIACFIGGIVFGFATAATAWLNFTIADDLYRRWAFAGEEWPSKKVDEHWKWLQRTTYFAMTFVGASIACLMLGAAIAMSSNFSASVSFVQMLNTAGIILSLIGVIVLFRYGMPFHVPTGGAQYIVTNETDQNEKALERRYEILGYCGLILIVVGAFAQVLAVWL